MESISLWLGTDCVCRPNRADGISLKEDRLLLMLSVFCLAGYSCSRTKKHAIEESKVDKRKKKLDKP